MKSKIYILSFLMLLSVLRGFAQHLDIEIAKRINPDIPDSRYWQLTSGSAYFVTAAIPLYILVKGVANKNPSLKNKAVIILDAIALELIISESMKVGFHRKRPGESFPMLIHPYRNVRRRSFPSGHTSLAFAVAASLSMQCKKWYITVPAYSWAATVGYSRMYLGVHYPSDVIAGAGVGIGSAYLSQWLNKKLFQNRKK